MFIWIFKFIRILRHVLYCKRFYLESLNGDEVFFYCKWSSYNRHEGGNFTVQCTSKRKLSMCLSNSSFNTIYGFIGSTVHLNDLKRIYALMGRYFPTIRVLWGKLDKLFTKFNPRYIPKIEWREFYKTDRELKWRSYSFGLEKSVARDLVILRRPSSIENLKDR